MKKTLLLCGLGLTVATSMVAGTMAIYTHTDTFLNADGTEVTGTAKKFFIDTSTTSTIKNFSLAPGESETWNFTVTNTKAGSPDYVSEVNTDLVVSLSSGEIKNWQDLKVTLNHDGVATPLTVNNGSLVVTKENAFKANDPKTETYSLVFTWVDDSSNADGNAADTLLAYEKNEGELPSISGIKVTVTGNQHVNK